MLRLASFVSKSGRRAGRVNSNIRAPKVSGSSSGVAAFSGFRRSYSNGPHFGSSVDSSMAAAPSTTSQSSLSRLLALVAGLAGAVVVAETVSAESESSNVKQVFSEGDFNKLTDDTLGKKSKYVVAMISPPEPAAASAVLVAYFHQLAQAMQDQENFTFIHYREKKAEAIPLQIILFTEHDQPVSLLVNALKVLQPLLASQRGNSTQSLSPLPRLTELLVKQIGEICGKDLDAKAVTASLNATRGKAVQNATASMLKALKADPRYQDQSATCLSEQLEVQALRFASIWNGGLGSQEFLQAAARVDSALTQCLESQRK